MQSGRMFWVRVRSFRYLGSSSTVRIIIIQITGLLYVLRIRGRLQSHNKKKMWIWLNDVIKVDPDFDIEEKRSDPNPVIIFEKRIQSLFHKFNNIFLNLLPF